MTKTGPQAQSQEEALEMKETKIKMAATLKMTLSVPSVQLAPISNLTEGPNL